MTTDPVAESQQAAEIDLREAADLSSRVIEQAPYGMYVVDGQFRLRQVNDVAMPAFAAVRPLIGRDFGEIMACVWGPELGAENAAIFRRTLETGERYVSPLYFERRHDLGVKQAFEWEVRRLTLPDGQHGVVCYFTEVTRRWHDQEALRLSEERFRIALDISELGAWELNLADHTAWRSPRHDQVFGYQQLLPAWTYETAREHVLEEDRDAWDRNFRRAIDEHKDWNFEVRIRRADGVLRWIWAYGKHIVNADGQAIRMFGIVADITERKATEAALRVEVLERERAEQALREREERARLEEVARKQLRQLEQRFRLMVDGVTDYAIFMLDAEGKVASWNRGAERMKGYRAEEIIGQHFSIFYPEVDRLAGKPQRELEVVAQTGRCKEEGWRIRKDGSRFWASMLITAIRNDEGELIGYAKVSRDLTERRAAEDRLLKSEERQRTLVASIADGVVSIDATGTVHSLNPAAEHMFGVKAGDVIGHNVTMLMPERFRSGHDRHVTRFAAQIDPRLIGLRREVVGMRSDGSEFPMMLALSVMPGDSEASFVALVTDLTEQKQHEERQQTLTQRLSLALRVSGIGVWDWNVESNAIAWDDAMYRIYGIAPGSAIDYAVWRNAVLSDDLAIAEAGLQAAIAQKTSQSRAFRIVHPTLGVRHIEADYSAVLDRDQQVVRVVGVNLDVTEHHRAAEALRQSNIQLEHGLALLARQNQEIRTLGELGETLQNCADMDEIRAPIRNFMPALFHGYSGCFYLLRASSNYLDAVADWGIAVSSAPMFPPADCWAIRRGEIRWTDARDGLRCRHLHEAEHLGLALCVPMIAQGDTLGILFIQPSDAPAIPPDAQARQELERMASMTADRIGIAIANIQLSVKLRLQSIRDPLTGLFNRRYLEETLEREMGRARRDQSSLAVLMLDVDHFKNFNDSYGHAVGDQVLRSIAETLGHACRVGDAVCRFGGEEFLVLMPETTLEQAAAKAEQLCDAIRRIEHGKSGLAIRPVTISIGVATFPRNADTRDGLLRTADQALYAAKKAGRDRVVSAG